MKFCQDHWNKLKQAIEERGLMHLVAPDSQTAMENIKEELAGTNTIENYDPLMNATHMIYGRAIECGGLYLMTGDFCPLCELEKYTQKGEDQVWINGCCDSILEYCRENRLVPLKQ